MSLFAQLHRSVPEWGSRKAVGTMETTLEESLEAIKAELRRQDEEWRRAKDAIAAMGDVRIALSREALDRLETRSTTTTPARAVVGGLRA
jgi:hypothetical protein